MRILPIVVAATLATLAIARLAPADTIELKDGRVFTGTIIENRSGRVTIEVVTSGIKAKLTFNRHEIASIDDTDTPLASPPETEAPPRQAPPATNTPPTPGATPSDTPKVFYAVIPLHGEFGAEIQAEGVRNALAKAKANGIEHIVFSIDSPGGFVSEAEAIVELMNAPENRNKFKYTAFVEGDAFSASVWPIFACESIVFSPAAASGAAVAYGRVGTTGAIEVDAKINAAIADRIAAYATPLGHDANVIQSMIVMSASCYGWIDHAGRTHITTTPPPSGACRKLVFQDTEKTVLSLTGTEAVESGVADGLATDPSEIGPLLGLDNWTLVPGIGPPQMATVKREYLAEQREKGKQLAYARKMRKQFPAAKDSLPDLINQARRADPDRFTYLYDSRTGLLTAQSRKDWLANTDNAIAAWYRVGTRASDLKKICTELTALKAELAKRDNCRCDLCIELAAEVKTIPDPTPFIDVMSQAESEVRRLNDRRDRTYF